MSPRPVSPTEGKYIVVSQVKDSVDHTVFKAETMIIFPAWVRHSRVAEAFGGLEHIVSAGFIHQDEHGQITCSGISETIGVESRPLIDKALAENLLTLDEEG